MIWPPTGTQPLPIDVVSIQSQVIYGRVGNNVAVPSFMQAGLTVAAVPTVLLSNTPHYPSLHGGPIPLEWFEGHLNDLALRGGLTQLRAVQGGYLGSAQQARVLAEWIHRQRGELPKLRVVIDPVIGDHDVGVYVAPELVEVYRRAVLPLADVITPNAFELAQLTGIATQDIEGTIAAARTLLQGQIKAVAVTSAAPASWPAGRMHIVLVEAQVTHLIDHPLIDIAPKGTGDLFAASLCANWLAGEPLPTAAQFAAAHVVHALRVTAQARCAELLLPGFPPEAMKAEVTIRTLPH